MTEFEPEEFPECNGCYWLVDGECMREPDTDLVDCYQEKELVNPALERWWKENHGSN